MEENCDISESGKKKLLSMFLDENNPVKDLKGKENGKSEDSSEVIKKAKKELEKTLSAEWGQRKKKKKKRSRSRSRSERKPLVDRETDNRKRKHTPEKDSTDISKVKKEKERSTSRDRDGKKKKKEKKTRKRSASREAIEKKIPNSEDKRQLNGK